jgi:tRNA(Ser,Leu) C12 N-acetylase TAN1
MTDEEIRKILKDHEERISRIEKILQKPRETKPKLGGIHANIIELVEEGVFNEPKSLSEVATELRIRGHYYSRDHVAVALLRLVRKKILRRIQQKREGKEIFAYVHSR